MTYQKNYVIEVKESPAMNVLTKRTTMGADKFGKYYGTLFERVPKERVTPTGLHGARYYDQEFNHESSDVELFIGIKEKDNADLVMEPVVCAMTIYQGNYSTLSESYGAIDNSRLFESQIRSGSTCVQDIVWQSLGAVIRFQLQIQLLYLL